jgi:phosphate:Na+ symporter
MKTILPAPAGPGAQPALGTDTFQEFLLASRERCLAGDLPWEERGAILELLGSAERAFFLIVRIEAERRSVPRAVVAPAEVPATLASARPRLA